MKLRRWVFAALLLGLAVPAAMARETRFPAVARLPGAGDASRTLVIYAATDLEYMRPVLDGFRHAHPEIAVVYHDLNSVELYERFLREISAGAPTADLVLSSAMDLQIKLVNDGYARRYPSLPARLLPEWAVWRYEAFGFTFEPVVLVYNRTLVPPEEVPRTRFELLRLLDTRRERYRGRVASYDPEQSGVGFLFATQDERYFQPFWTLVASLGASDVQLFASTSAILSRVAEGSLLIGYNLLGSYARAYAEDHPALGVALLRDYTLVLSRTAFIPRAAPRPELAGTFLDFLLGEDGQRILARAARLYSIHPEVSGEATARRLRAELGTALRPIEVGPGLLVYLDQAKRRRFLRRWREALGRPSPVLPGFR